MKKMIRSLATCSLYACIALCALGIILPKPPITPTPDQPQSLLSNESPIPATKTSTKVNTSTPTPTNTATPGKAVLLATNTRRPIIPTQTSTPTSTPTPTDTAVPHTPIVIVITATNTPDSSFDENEYIEKLTTGLSINAGGRQIESILVGNGRAKGGERTAIIGYITTESTETGYINEMVDIFRATAASIRAYNLDLDSVTLVAANAFGKAEGVINVSVDDLLAYHRGEISRSEFLRRLVITTF